MNKDHIVVFIRSWKTWGNCTKDVGISTSCLISVGHLTQTNKMHEIEQKATEEKKAKYKIISTQYSHFSNFIGL